MKEKELKSIFNRFIEADIQFIVLRGFDEIPNKVTYINDLDILGNISDKGKILNIFKELDYKYYKDSIENNKYLYHALPHDHFRNKTKDLHIDIVYNLSYKSPNQGEWISIDEELQKSIWENKRKVNKLWLYQPSNQDEFIHLVCHSIFDKQEFQLKHINRINYLFKDVNKEDTIKKLNLVFFKFTPYLMSYIDKKDYQNIIKNYLKFKEY